MNVVSFFTQAYVLIGLELLVTATFGIPSSESSIMACFNIATIW